MTSWNTTGCKANLHTKHQMPVRKSNTHTHSLEKPPTEISTLNGENLLQTMLTQFLKVPACASLIRVPLYFFLSEKRGGKEGHPLEYMQSDRPREHKQDGPPAGSQPDPVSCR